jgi:hypothetical protein
MLKKSCPWIVSARHIALQDPDALPGSTAGAIDPGREALNKSAFPSAPRRGSSVAPRQADGVGEFVST